jgi:kynureninase
MRTLVVAIAINFRLKGVLPGFRKVDAMPIAALVSRKDFPIVTHTCYLSSHSLGAMPAGTPKRLQDYCQAWAEQGCLAWEDSWWNSIAQFTQAVERVLDADADTVVPCLNVSLGMAAVASCLDYAPGRNRVVMSELEFTTTLPFWEGQRSLGAEPVVVSDSLLPAIDERTVLVVASQAFFRSGALQDLESLQAHCRSVGSLLLVDGYQGIGAVPFSARTLDPDFVVGGCHKWLCGGPGGGFLYVRPELVGRLRPRLTGWFGLANPFDYSQGQSEPHPGVRRFLNGTPNVPGLFAAAEGLRIVAELGLPAIRAHSQALTELLLEGARQRGLEIRTPQQPERRNGMVCLEFDGARELQQALQDRRVTVDWRPDCGMRVSPHFYSDQGDIERFWSEFDRART